MVMSDLIDILMSDPSVYIDNLLVLLLTLGIR